MRTHLLVALVLSTLLALAACQGLNTVTDEDTASTPTVYAKVTNAPNPLLMGHWRRPPPSNLKRPWSFQYWLVKRGDRYAVYYYYDSHKKNSFKGWADFTIDGDTMVSGVDGVVFSVKGGVVSMTIPGRNEVYDMDKID